MTLHVNLGPDSYDILIERGCLSSAGKHLNLDRKVLVVTDSGVPARYSQTVAAQCRAPFVMTVPSGESSKSADSFLQILRQMLNLGFDRGDCVVAVGGGVVGDLSGFAASCYMRGVDFYNIPTTLLSQVDSSIGGKTAIDFEGVKNIVGTFYQPKMVLIDPDVLGTLPDRQISAGLAEVIKMAATSDKELFGWLENHDLTSDMEHIIAGALDIKRRVVEQDEKESGLRKVLNFGHTLGHGIESEESGRLYHGECVALGMLPMTSDSVRIRLIPLLRKAGLPVAFHGNEDLVMEAVAHDKKSSGDRISAVFVDEIGQFRLEKVDIGELRKRLMYFKG